MSKAAALARIGELQDEFADVTHATLNASPGVGLADRIRADLAEIEVLVDAITEAT